MSYPQSTKDQFLTLRADGLSYAQCAQQLNVSRHTLITWAKEMKPQLDAIRAIHTESLLDQVQLRLHQRIILLAAQYHRVVQTIEKANLLAPGVSTLFTILLKLNAALDKYDIDPASLPIRENQCESVSKPSSNLPIENCTTLEKTEPPITQPELAENTELQPITNKELTTPNPTPPKTEPKLNHPEVTALPIENRKSDIENSSDPNPAHQRFREEFNRKYAEHKARQAS